MVDMEEEGAEKAGDSTQSRQLLWVFIILGLLIIIVVGTPYAKHRFFDQFEHLNLDFQKVRLAGGQTGNVIGYGGGLILYTAFVPVVDESGKITSEYRVAFRNDPRDLAAMPIDNRFAKNGGISFIERNQVYISIDPFMQTCEDNSLAMLILGGFLQDAGLNVTSAFSDEEFAQENNQTYIDCDHSAHNTVIKITSGDETTVTRERTNCFEIMYTAETCDVITAVERFNYEILSDYMSNFVPRSELDDA